MSNSLPVPDPLLLGAPGLRIESATGPEGLATALYSPCDRYRYRVSRVWDDRLPRVCFLLLNPSTATAFQLDPTLRRVYRYARDWGMGSFEVTNIFAYRSTDPSLLYRVDDPVGVHNDGAILDAARSATLRVAGWGAHGRRALAATRYRLTSIGPARCRMSVRAQAFFGGSGKNELVRRTYSS